MNKKLFKGIYAVYLIILVILSFFIINNKMLNDNKIKYQNEILKLAKITALTIDKDSVSYLIENLNDENLKDSPQYKKIEEQLIKINEIYSDISDISYIFYPSNNPDYVYIIVSSDRCGMELYDISDYPEMIKTNIERTPSVGDILRDPQQGGDVWSMTACVPIYDNYKYLGSIGIDMFLENYEKNILYAKIYSMMLTISVICIGGILIPLFIEKTFDYISSGKIKNNIKFYKTRRAIAKAKRDNKL